MQYSVGDPIAPFGDAFSLSVASAEYRLWPIERIANGLPTDPTSHIVRATFAPPGTMPTNWVQVLWETWTAPFGPIYSARVGIGQGLDIQLTPGIYVPWFQLTDTPTLAVIPAQTPIVVR